MASNTESSRHRVLYDYDAASDAELTIRTDQIVFVTEELDKGWVRGYIAGDSPEAAAMFPAAYITPEPASSGPPLSALPSVPTPHKLLTPVEAGAASAEMAQVMEDWPTKDSSQLPLRTGDMVIILRKFPTGWASGECQGKTGMFPLKHVRILEMSEAAHLRASLPHSSSPTPPSSSSSTSTTSKKTSTNKEKRMSRIRSSTVSSVTKASDGSDDEDATGGSPATVMFDYTAADKGQLSLLAGETICVLEKLGGGWWKGRTEDGEVGFFPGSYVRELGSGASSPRVTAGGNSSTAAPGGPSPANGGGVSAAVANSSGGSNLKRASTVSKPSLKKATAIYKYVAKTSSELSFEVGDEVLVFPVKEGEAGGWWTGALASAPTQVAHFPASYVKLIGSIDDSRLGEPKSDKKDKRKSQPAQRVNGSVKIGAGGSSSTTTSSTSTSSKPPSKPPPQPFSGASADDAPSAPGYSASSNSSTLQTSSDTSMVSPRSGWVGNAGSSTGSGVTSPFNGSSVNLDELTRSSDQAIKTAEGATRAAENATKTADQAKAGLVKLQQQSKTVFDGLLQRLEASDKDRQRLEHAMREMHKMIQQSEAQRSKLEQQNKALYLKLGEVQNQLQQEASSRASLEARLSRLEQHH